MPIEWVGESLIENTGGPLRRNQAAKLDRAATLQKYRIGIIVLIQSMEILLPSREDCGLCG